MTASHTNTVFLLVSNFCWLACWLSLTEVYCISITGLQDHHHQLFQLQVFTAHHSKIWTQFYQGEH